MTPAPPSPPRSSAVPPFPPRGVKSPRETAPNALWAAPETLGEEWTYKSGCGVLLGMIGQRLLGVDDDRHMVTIAGSRAGKSQTVIIPNLLRYDGPAVVIDPKGELYEATAAARQAMGHKVILLNPFNVRGLGSHGYNPLAELLLSENISADAAQIADALIIAPDKGDAHWTDAAKNLLTGLILHMLTTNPERATIPALRALVNNEEGLLGVLEAMADNEALNGVIQNIGLSMLGKTEKHDDGSRSFTREMSSIISTATEQTRPLDDVAVCLVGDDLRLSELSGKNPVTVYLVVPAMRIATHHRWLRLFVYQVLAALEVKPIHRKRKPLWLVLEEFAALGNVRSIEAAAGYMAGFGVKLWAILQDLSQLKRHYPESWETFLGNAGCIQAFGTIDMTTNKYLSSLLGDCTVTEIQKQPTTDAQRRAGDMGVRENLRQVPLLAPAEIALHFSREIGRQLILVSGKTPLYMNRLPYKDN